MAELWRVVAEFGEHAVGSEVTKEQAAEAPAGHVVRASVPDEPSAEHEKEG